MMKHNIEKERERESFFFLWVFINSIIYEISLNQSILNNKLFHIIYGVGDPYTILNYLMMQIVMHAVEEQNT